MNPANNINGVDGDKNGDGKGIEIHRLAKKRVTKVQEAYLRWLVTGLTTFDNLLFEVSNETEPYSTEWQYHVIRAVSPKACQDPSEETIPSAVWLFPPDFLLHVGEPEPAVVWTVT